MASLTFDSGALDQESTINTEGACLATELWSAKARSVKREIGCLLETK